MPDLKGLWHLRELVARPHQPIPALSLIGAAIDIPLPAADTGPVLDQQALIQYRRRLADLDDELDAAALRGDTARQAKGSAERDALIAELKRATGLGGRPRRSGSPAEKARLNVTRTIRHAINESSMADRLVEFEDKVAVVTVARPKGDDSKATITTGLVCGGTCGAGGAQRFELKDDGGWVYVENVGGQWMA